jgi:hypothetical protein
VVAEFRHLDSVGYEGSRAFRIKRWEYLKDKINELETDSKQKY